MEEKVKGFRWDYLWVVGAPERREEWEGRDALCCKSCRDLLCTEAAVAKYDGPFRFPISDFRPPVLKLSQPHDHCNPNVLSRQYWAGLEMMWTGPWLVHCLSITAAIAFSHHDIQYEPNPYLEQPIGVQAPGAGKLKRELYSLHRSLVNIESISGNEHNVGTFFESHLQHHNYTVERQYVNADSTTEQPRRFNLLAYPGTKRQTRILLSSHIDTVPPYYGYSIREDNQIWGRGSVDAKACVATQFQALQELLASEEISHNDASLLFVVSEETGGEGMHTVNDLNMKWETVIFGEPTELKLAAGHKGVLIFSIKAHGKAGHSGYPWLGANANHMLIPVLAALQQLELPSSKKYGNSTLNIGQIQGGVAANVMAESAIAKIGIRIAGGDIELVKKHILETVKKVGADDIEVTFSGTGYGPVDVDHDIEGFETITVNYGTDIMNLEGDHKRYLYGPGNILVAHSDHEHLAADELLTAVEGYKKLILAALKK